MGTVHSDLGEDHSGFQGAFLVLRIPSILAWNSVTEYYVEGRLAKYLIDLIVRSRNVYSED